MTKPYLLVSDLHCHDWSQFASRELDGVNSRLKIILDELDRAVAELKSRGGDLIVIAGDLFHVRGSISPEVFNPVQERFHAIASAGFRLIAIPGNHDLASKETTEIGNAFQSLSSLPNFFVATKPDSSRMGVALIPWQASVDGLRKAVAAISDGCDVSETDLIIHAGIDKVLPNMPDHGLSAEEIASWGYKRVFAGHYHNHAVLADGKVISIGATTHQTWSDIGTKAGYLLVYPDSVEYRASHAPSFVELTGEDDPAEYELIVQGNYVRVRSMKLTDAEIQLLRSELIGMGAIGITFQVAKEVTSARTGAAATKSVSLDESVSNYVANLKEIDVSAVQMECASILSDVRSAAD